MGGDEDPASPHPADENERHQTDRTRSHDEDMIVRMDLGETDHINRDAQGFTQAGHIRRQSLIGNGADRRRDHAFRHAELAQFAEMAKIGAELLPRVSAMGAEAAGAGGFEGDLLAGTEVKNGGSNRLPLRPVPGASELRAP